MYNPSTWQGSKACEMHDTIVHTQLGSHILLIQSTPKQSHGHFGGGTMGLNTFCGITETWLSGLGTMLPMYH